MSKLFNKKDYTRFIFSTLLIICIWIGWDWAIKLALTMLIIAMELIGVLFSYVDDYIKQFKKDRGIV